MDRWWDEHAKVLGVFQGGGAKGIAYAGALRALEARHVWFSQVAGSSAGAITAALVAAGVHPRDFDVITRTALSKIRKVNRFRFYVGWAESMYETRDFASWLEELLRLYVLGAADAPGDGVTFEQLEKGGIACHVVALDLATGHPIVFSGDLTPRATVVEAVLASSAIPAGLPAGRAIYESDGGSRVVHHVVDGGAWANYPAFVFRDRAFRQWAAAGTAGEAISQDTHDVPLVGLTLDSPRDSRQEVVGLPSRTWRGSQHFDIGTARSMKSAGTYVLSMVLASPWLRVTALVAAAALGLLVFIQTLPEWIGDVGEEVHFGDSWWSGIGFVTSWTGSFAAVLTGIIVAFVALAPLLITVVLLLYGRPLALSIIPSADALIGVPTRVPPWAHSEPHSIVLNLPSSGVGTTEFNLPRDVQANVVQKAREAATRQLDHQESLLTAWGGQPARPEPPEVPAVPEGKTRIPLSDVRRFVFGTAVTGILALSAVSVAAGWFHGYESDLQRALFVAGTSVLVVHTIARALWPKRLVGKPGEKLPVRRLSHLETLATCSILAFSIAFLSFVLAGIAGDSFASYSSVWVRTALGISALTLLMSTLLVAVQALKRVHLLAYSRARGVPVHSLSRVCAGFLLAGLLGAAAIAATSKLDLRESGTQRVVNSAQVTSESGARTQVRYAWSTTASGPNEFVTPVRLRIGERVRIEPRDGAPRLASERHLARSVIPALLAFLAIALLYYSIDEFAYRRFRTTVAKYPG